MLETVEELACVTTSILPLVLAEAFWLALRVLTNIAVAIGEKVGAVTITKTLMPLTLVFVAIGEDVYTVSLRLRVNPLTNI